MFPRSRYKLYLLTWIIWGVSVGNSGGQQFPLPPPTPSDSSSAPGASAWIQPLPPTGPPLQFSPGTADVEIIPVPPDAVEADGPWFEAFNPWTGSFEIGMSGSQGNSETMTLRLGAEATRPTPSGELSMEFSFSKGSNDGVESEHEALLDGRHEWQWKKSPWTAFVHGALDYDEFRAFDVRLSADTGVGYTLIESDTTKFTVRAGGGGSRELDGPDKQFVPEGLGGLKFERKFTKRQKLVFTVDYFQDVTDLGDFRANGKIAWEMLVDPEMNLNLKLSVSDRYDSTPNGAKRNDLDYSLLMLWKY